MGHLYYQYPRLRDNCRRAQKILRAKGLGGPSWNSVFGHLSTTEQWTLNNCGCLHKIKPVNILLRRWNDPWTSTLIVALWIFEDSLLGMCESVFIKLIVTGRLTTFQWIIPHQRVCGQHKLASVHCWKKK